MTPATMQRRITSKALGALTQERYDRLRRREQIPTRDQIRDLVILENLEHDLVAGSTFQHDRYGLVAPGGAS